MEQFFTPTRRYQALLERTRDADDGPFEEKTEVQLTLPVEESLSHCCWDWEALRAYCFAGGDMCTLLWIIEHAFIIVKRNGFRFGNVEVSLVFHKIHAVIQDTSGQEQKPMISGV
jgi:hypothetical protein